MEESRRVEGRGNEGGRRVGEWKGGEMREEVKGGRERGRKGGEGSPLYFH